MPHQNRVLASGEIVAHPARGLFMGNRGILHDDDGNLGTARWRHKAWVTCLLEYKGQSREILQPRNYTELFFLDEAVAFAAGHRPCALCRRPAYRAYLEAVGHDGTVADLDNRLHTERAVARRSRLRRHQIAIDTLPDGTVVVAGDTPKLVLGRTLRPITPDGYGPPEARPRTGDVSVATPPTSLEALRAGYRLTFHPSL